MDCVASRALKIRPQALWKTAVDGIGLTAHLVKSNFTPTLDLVFTDLVEADFDGYTGGMTATVPAMYRSIDPVLTGFYIDIDLAKDELQEQVAGVTHLPQTIYGVGVVDEQISELAFAVVFDTPIPLTGIGQGVLYPTRLCNFFDGYMV
jgi:hypothetical protein